MTARRAPSSDEERRTIQRLLSADVFLFVTAALILGLAWTFDWPASVRIGVLCLFAFEWVMLLILLRVSLLLRWAASDDTGGL